MLARTLRIVAVVLTALIGFVATAFVVGETFDDPGGMTAVGLSAAWVVPMLALVLLVLWRPDLATWLLPALTAVVAVFVLLDASLGLVPRDVGPLDGLLVLVLAVPTGLLGWRRPRLAGFSLVAMSVLLLVASALTRTGAPLTAILGGSSGVLVLPLLLVGGLLVLAWLLESPEPHEPQDRVRPPAGTTTG